MTCTQIVPDYLHSGRRLEDSLRMNSSLHLYKFVLNTFHLQFLSQLTFYGSKLGAYGIALLLWWLRGHLAEQSWWDGPNLLLDSTRGVHENAQPSTSFRQSPIYLSPSDAPCLYPLGSSTLFRCHICASVSSSLKGNNNIVHFIGIFWELSKYM